MMREDLQRQEDREEEEELTPQIKIYNRNFYLRNARFQDLQNEAQKEIQELAAKPKMTPNSYVILVQKLESQLNQLYLKHIQDANELGFEKFSALIYQLGKFNQLRKEQQLLEVQLLVTQLWIRVINYDLKVVEISKNKCTSLVHILFCPYRLKFQEMVSLLDHAFPLDEDKLVEFMEGNPAAKEQIHDSEDLIRLWFRIKQNYICTFADGKKAVVQENIPTFKPEINPKSKEIAEKELQKYMSDNRLDNVKTSKLNELSGYISEGKQLSYHDILYRRALQKEKLLKTTRAEMLPRTKERTLTVQETKRLVQNLFFVNNDRKEVPDYDQIKEEEELKLCTFKPTTTEYRKKTNAPTVKNYAKQIDRLEEGRKKKEKLQEAFENLGRVKSKNLGPPPSMVERQKPRLILEIKVGERTVQLKLKGDEQPRVAAKKFMAKHGLDETMQQVLESVIQQQLAAL